MSKPPLRSNERQIATYLAGRSQGHRVVGGHLLLTDQRLIFYPHKLDDAMGGKRWECKLESIEGVGRAARGMNPWNGSTRRRLTVESALSVEYFVVNKLDAKAATINETVSSRRA